MNEDYIVYLVDIRDELQSFMHYDNITNAFMDLFLAWRAYGIRHHMHNPSFYSGILSAECMKRADAESFCKYIHSGHFWTCLM